MLEKPFPYSFDPILQLSIFLKSWILWSYILFYYFHPEYSCVLILLISILFHPDYSIVPILQLSIFLNPEYSYVPISLYPYYSILHSPMLLYSNYPHSLILNIPMFLYPFNHIFPSWIFLRSYAPSIQYSLTFRIK